VLGFGVGERTIEVTKEAEIIGHIII
jgi:hypothetical protein